MKRSFWIIWLAIIIVLSSARVTGPVLAQEPGLEMKVSVGFDGYCRASGGGWCPVLVVLTNDKVDITGELQIAVGGTGGNTKPNIYAKPVVLPARSRKAYTLYVPSARSSVRSSLTVELFVDQQRRAPLVWQRVDVAWLSDKSQLYGVVSSRPSALNFLSDVASATVAHVDLETLPANPLGWEGLDVLILNDVDTSVLSGEQRRALEIWVAQGGHLIVGGGAGAARAAVSVADLLPVALGGTRLVDELWALGEWMNAPVDPGPYAVVEASLQEGDALVGQDELLLVAQREYGAGQVSFLAFDAGLKPFRHWDDNGLLWELIIGTQSADEGHFAVLNGYTARDAINAIPGLDVPSTLQLLAFMLVYTLLIGPVNYIILYKLDRRELAWLTIPVLILCFSAFAYLTGFQVRGGTAIVHQLAAVYVPEGAEVGRMSELVGLFSPRRTTYDVQVDSLGVQEITEEYYGGPARQPLHVIQQSNDAMVTDLRVDVGGIRPFVAEGYVEVPPVEADLKLDTTGSGALRVDGTLHTDELALKDAVILSGLDEQRLGDLEPGQEVSFHLSYPTSSSPYGPSYTRLAERILGSGSYWDDRELYRKYQFLQSLFPYDGRSGAPLQKGVYLVGWLEGEVPLAVKVADRPFSTVGMTLYVYALPVKGLDTGATITIPPSFIPCELETSVGQVDVQAEGRGCHLGSEAEVEFRCTVWEGVEVEKVNELTLDLHGGSYGASSDPPTVWLWNYQSQTWRELNVGWGLRKNLSTGEEYVSVDGELRVRLKSGVEQSVEVESLSFTIKGQR